MSKRTLKSVARYCADNIDCWDAKCEIALDAIGKHFPIDYSFRDEIMDCVSEWCDENEVSLDFFDDDEEIAEDIIMCEL